MKTCTKETENRAFVKAFPKYIQDQLDQPAPGNPGRHEAWRSLAYQMVGEGIPEETIFHELRRWIPDKDKPDSELRRAIAGAHRRNPTPATGRISNGAYDPERKIIRFKAAEAPNRNEIPRSDLSTIEFLTTIFREGEIICATNYSIESDGKFQPGDAGTFWTREKWCEEFGKRGETFLSGDAGAWIRLNPIKPDDKSGTDASIADFRHLLVEFDSKPKDEQWRIFQNSRLPLAAVIDSGDKSLHGWVKIDAKDLTEFRERQKFVYDYLADHIDDGGNINPSRFSRLPGVKRGDKIQRLVAVNIGATTWEEFEELAIDDGLPATQDLSEFMERVIVEPYHLYQGFWRVGQVISVAGAMKTNKSWTMMEMGQALPNGGHFMKWEVNMGKVFYIDTELEEWDYQFRHKCISGQTKFHIDRGDFRFKLLRGCQSSIDDLVPKILREIRGKGYKAVFFDSIYSLLGDREENSNEDISSLGMALIWLAKQAGVGIAFSHHFSKGSKAGKRGIEKTSGAGAWGRFVDAGLAIDHHPKDGHYNIEPEYRTFAQEPPFVARRINGRWSVTDLKVEHKDQRSSAQTDLLDLLVNELGGEATPGDWKELANTQLHMSEPTFDRRKKDMLGKYISQTGKGKKTVCKLKPGVAKNPETELYELPKTTFKAISSKSVVISDDDGDNDGDNDDREPA
jgi:RecA-family ATPase